MWRWPIAGVVAPFVMLALGCKGVPSNVSQVMSPTSDPYVGPIHADRYEIVILIEDDTKSTFTVRLDTDLSSDLGDELPFHIQARRTYMIYGGVPSSGGPLDPWRGQHEVYGASWVTLADLREGVELTAWDEPEFPGFSKLSDESLMLEAKRRAKVSRDWGYLQVSWEILPEFCVSVFPVIGVMAIATGKVVTEDSWVHVGGQRIGRISHEYIHKCVPFRASESGQVHPMR